MVQRSTCSGVWWVMLMLMRAGVWDKGCSAGAGGRAPANRESGDTRGHHVLVQGAPCAVRHRPEMLSLTVSPDDPTSHRNQHPKQINFTPGIKQHPLACTELTESKLPTHNVSSLLDEHKTEKDCDNCDMIIESAHLPDTRAWLTCCASCRKLH